MVIEVPQPGFGASIWSTRATTASASCRARRRSADLDEPVDLVLLGVPDAVLLDQLGWPPRPRRPGRPSCSVPRTGGLRDVAAIATDAGMAVCGAGCMGFVNNALGVRALGYLEPDPLPDGGVSLVTHSGSAFSTLLRARRGFGFRLAVSSGQELVTDTADYVDYALDDPETRIIGLLLETPRAVPRLRRRCCAPRSRTCPSCILTVGGSPRGQGDGGRPLGRAGRRACGMAGVLRGDRRDTRQRSRRVQRHPRTVLRRTAGQARRHCDRA